MTDLPHYDSWRAVPPGVYLTKTQLAELDLPRRPGPQAATVDGYDYRDKKAVLALYRIDQSTPSPATPKALAAARARTNGPDPHSCTDCGAHPDLAVTVYTDDQRLCRTCAHIRALRAQQDVIAQQRANTAARAADLLAGQLAVVHCELVDRGTTPSGAPRSPAAVRVAVVDQAGAQLADTTVRLVGQRAKGVPVGAIPADDAGQMFATAFADRRLVTWADTGFGDLIRALREAGWTEAIPSGYGRHHDLRAMTLTWRGDIDPMTRGHRLPVPPGRADRMLWLLQQIAAGAQGGHSEGAVERPQQQYARWNA
jgi:hypothetical protein